MTEWYEEMLAKALEPLGDNKTIARDTHNVLLSYYQSAYLAVDGVPATLSEEGFPVRSSTTAPPNKRSFILADLAHAEHRTPYAYTAYSHAY